VPAITYTHVDPAEVTSALLDEYATVSAAFEAHTRLEVTLANSCDASNVAFDIHEQPLASPLHKNYDTLDGGANHPRQWLHQHDLSQWGLFLARTASSALVGAAAVAPPGAAPAASDDPEAAVLWDLRVQPAHRRQGVGIALFHHARDWAAATGARRFEVETQDTNPAACHFYQRQGCHLIAVDPTAYRDSPDVQHEVMLTWSLAVHPIAERASGATS